MYYNIKICTLNERDYSKRTGIRIFRKNRDKNETPFQTLCHVTTGEKIIFETKQEQRRLISLLHYRNNIWSVVVTK